jgi:hypothetical protein
VVPAKIKMTPSMVSARSLVFVVMNRDKFLLLLGSCSPRIHPEMAVKTKVRELATGTDSDKSAL